MTNRKHKRPAEKDIPRSEKALIKRGMLGNSRKHSQNALGKQAKQILSQDAAKVGETMDELAERLALREEFGPPPAVPFKRYENLSKRRQAEMLNTVRLRELREIARQDFWFFLYEVLYSKASQKKHYLPDFHSRICDELQNLQPGENFLLCIPRESRKSMLTLAYLAWLVIRDPDIRIKLVAKDQNRAKKLSTLLRQMFHVDFKNKFPLFQEVFPDFVIKSRKELLQAQQFTHPLRAEAYLDPTVYATFLGSAGAGGRCDVLLIDDGWDAQTLSNPDQGTKVMQQLIDLVPTVEGSALGQYKNIIILTTPWRHYDPTAIFLGYTDDEKTSDKRAEFMPKFKAMVRHAKESSEPCTICPKWVTDRYPHGHPDMTHGHAILAPIFDDETLQDRYNFYQMQPDLGEQSFYLQYMCVYHNPKAAKFQEEWFVFYNSHDFPVPRRRVLTLDDASKDFQQLGRGDYSVAKFGSFDDEGRLLKRHALRSNKWTRDQFIQQILAWCQQSNWWPQIAAKEKVGVDSFLTDLQREFNKLGRPVVVIPVPRVGLGRKLDYIVSTLQGPYERREIVYGSLYPRDLFERDVYELTHLGSTAHDDMPDADCLFFAPKVRVTRSTRLGTSTGRSMHPMDIGNYDPSRQPAQQLVTAPAPEPTITDRTRADEQVRAALLHAGIEPDSVKWTYRAGEAGPGQSPAVTLRAATPRFRPSFKP